MEPKDYSKGYRTKVHTPLLTDLGIMVGGSQRLMSMYGGQSKRGGFIAKLIRQDESKYNDVDPSLSMSVRDKDSQELLYKLDRSKFLLNRMGREPTDREKRWQESATVRALNPIINFVSVPSTEEQQENEEIVRERVGMLESDAAEKAGFNRMLNQIENEDYFGYRNRVKQYLELLGATIRQERIDGRNPAPIIKLLKIAVKVLLKAFNDGESINEETGRIQKTLPNGVVFDDSSILDGLVKPKRNVKTDTDASGQLIYKPLKYPEGDDNFGYPFIIDVNEEAMWY
jgi:hypothetical protein